MRSPRGRYRLARHGLAVTVGLVLGASHALAVQEAKRAADDVAATADRTGDRPSASRGDDASSSSLQGIERSVSEMTELLRRQVEQQDVAMALKRAELSTYLLVEASRQVDSMREERFSYREMLENSERSFGEMTDEVMPDGAPADPEMREQLRRMREMQEREVARMRERLTRLDLRLAEVESESSSLRDDIARWQEVVDDYFEKRKSGR